jgi:hypothetical protein
MKTQLLFAYCCTRVNSYVLLCMYTGIEYPFEQNMKHGNLLDYLQDRFYFSISLFCLFRVKLLPFLGEMAFIFIPRHPHLFRFDTVYVPTS